MFIWAWGNLGNIARKVLSDYFGNFSLSIFRPCFSRHQASPKAHPKENPYGAPRPTESPNPPATKKELQKIRKPRLSPKVNVRSPKVKARSPKVKKSTLSIPKGIFEEFKVFEISCWVVTVTGVWRISNPFSILPKNIPPNYANNIEGSYGVALQQIYLNKGTFTNLYGIRAVTLMAYNPQPLCHMNRFYWGWDGLQYMEEVGFDPCVHTQSCWQSSTFPPLY